jgi:holliday junction DNA helicase RuvB
MPMDVEQMLYEALEDGTFTVATGTGNDAKSFTFNLPPMVIVGATTKTGSLSQPLRDRFGFHATLALDSARELDDVVDER